MKTLTSATQVAVAKTFTKPLYLIEFDWSPTTRLCTFDTVTWNSQTWVADVPVTVSGIGQGPTGPTAGSVTIGNATGLYGALVLQQAVLDKSVRIWAADADALSALDPVFLFDGVVSAAEVTVEQVTLSLARAGSGTMKSPRRYIEPASGFNTLIPAGTKITVGGETYILERRK